MEHGKYLFMLPINIGFIRDFVRKKGAPQWNTLSLLWLKLKTF